MKLRFRLGHSFVRHAATSLAALTNRLSPAPWLTALTASAAASAGVTGLEVQYGGFVGGKHVWNVFALNPVPTERLLYITSHTLTAGSMATVQHSDGATAQGGSWLPGQTPADGVAFDSFVTINGSGGSADTTLLDPSFGPGTGPLIPPGAGWFRTGTHLFSVGRIKIMQVAGASLYPGAPGYSAQLSAGVLSSTGFSTASGLRYALPGPCVTADRRIDAWTAGSPIAWSISGLQAAANGARIGIQARGAFLNQGGGARIEIRADGQFVGELQLGDVQCGVQNPFEFFMTIPAPTYNAAVADGVLALTLTPRSFTLCPPSPDFPSFIHARLWSDYSDCDANSVNDTCQLAGNDCNGNGRLDSCDIASGTPDSNGDGIPDSCQAPSPDLNGDGFVDGNDLGTLLAAWGPSNGPADFNRDGFVDGNDLGTLLAAWGAVP